MPTYRAGILKDLILEKNLVVKDFEQALGYSNGGLGKAIEDNSKLKEERVDRLFSTFPSLNPDWLATGQPPMFIEQKKDAPLDDEQGALNEVEAAWLRIDKAVQAATEAAQAATRIAELLESRLTPAEERILEHDARIGAIHNWLDEQLQPILSKKPGQIGGELNIAFRQIQERKKTGTRADQGTVNT